MDSALESQELTKKSIFSLGGKTRALHPHFLQPQEACRHPQEGWLS